MSLRQDLKNLLRMQNSEDINVPLALMRQCRNTLVNSSRDDEETEFLLANLQGRQDLNSVPATIVQHMIDFLRGEQDDNRS